jgi:hypothetical protein
VINAVKQVAAAKVNVKMGRAMSQIALTKIACWRNVAMQVDAVTENVKMAIAQKPIALMKSVPRLSCR